MIITKQDSITYDKCRIGYWFLNQSNTKPEFHSAEGQKKLFQYRNSKFAGEFKTRAMAETTSLSSTPLLEPKLTTSISNLNKKITEIFG